MTADIILFQPPLRRQPPLKDPSHTQVEPNPPKPQVPYGFRAEPNYYLKALENNLPKR